MPNTGFNRRAQLMATCRGVGFSRAKTASLKDIATKTFDGAIPKRLILAKLSDEAIIEWLTAARGVGRLTGEKFLIFTLGRPDELPVDDYGIHNGYQLAYGKRRLPKPRLLAEFSERSAPYRTTAS